MHIASGCSALAYALVLGKRKLHGQKHMTKPHNVSMVFIGTLLIWFGWFGFNVTDLVSSFQNLATDKNRVALPSMVPFDPSWQRGTQMCLQEWVSSAGHLSI